MQYILLQQNKIVEESLARCMLKDKDFQDYEVHKYLPCVGD